VIIVERDDAGDYYGSSVVGGEVVENGPRHTLRSCVEDVARQITDHPDFQTFVRRAHG
jgi:hypothetical protein